MSGRRLLGLLVLALTVAACGRQPASEGPGAGAAAPGAASNTPVQAAGDATSNPPARTTGVAATTKVTRPNEDGSETVEETTGDSGTHNPILAAVASTMAAGVTAAGAATSMAGPTLWQEGVNYTQLVPAQPTAVAPGQVEVLEFFWYGCPHCYAIDPQIEAWRKTKAAYIGFSRVPVMWSEAHRSTARLYYTLASMGKVDQLHSDIFKEIHVNNDPLIGANINDAAAAERLQTTFVTKLGVPADAFTKAYHSFAVETELQRADQLGLRYRIEGVPTFVVNGKFVADVRSAGGPEKLLALVDDLAAQEHKR